MEVEFKENDFHEGEGKSKCLLLGGYVVLDHENTGICIDLDPKIVTKTKITNLNDSEFIINVKSNPSGFTATFTKSHWQDPSTFKGKFERFILASFYVFFSFFNVKTPATIEMEITGDPKFYSAKGKTGLGSSSGTTISILMSLLKFTNYYNHDLLFKLASVAHSFAQGKLGSCFDISTAIWGTQIYRRPSADKISIEKINEPWDNEHKALNFPKNTKLWLVNSGFSGSSTQNLVELFNSNKTTDKELFNELVSVINKAGEAIEKGDLSEIKATFEQVKGVQRKITKKWNVSILPEKIDTLITKIEEIHGVITAIPPGAGGYDAVAVLTSSDVKELGSDISVLATKTF